MWMGSSHENGVNGMLQLENGNGISVNRKLQIFRSFDGSDLPSTFSNSSCRTDATNQWRSAYSFVATGDNGRLQAIAAGNYDNRIANWVRSVPQGHKVDIGFCHEANAKVAKGNATVSQVNNAYLRAAQVFDQLRSDGVSQVTSGNVQLAICLTNSNFNNQSQTTMNRFNDAIEVVDTFAVDIYAGSAGDQRQWSRWATDYLNWWNNTGSGLGTGEWGMWETSASDAKGSIENKTRWINESVRGAYENGAEYYCAFNSTVNGSQLYFNRQQYADLFSDLMDQYAEDGSGPSNQNPTARFNFTVTGFDVDFDGRNSSDPDGNITVYFWDFGDGQVGAGAQPEHTYSSSGQYVVRLTVTDNDGGSHSINKTVSINVDPPPPPPPPPPSDSGRGASYSFVLT